jgi:uncharacterized protein (DUF169 family)
VFLTPDNTDCRGARYVFGWDDTIEDEMITNLQFHEGFSREAAQRLMRDLPRLTEPPKGIAINGNSVPDILMAYLQPEQFMNISRAYQIRFGKSIRVDISSIVSVCGHVAAESFTNQRISLSFGCIYSRRYSRVTRDRLATGIPLRIANDLLGATE